MKYAVIYAKCAVMAVLGLLIFAICTPQAFAQYKAAGGLDHVEIGVFGELFRISQTDTNLAGVGARLSFNVLPLLQIEAETAYDFNQIFTETDPTGAFIQRTNLRAIHGLFGPKLETNRGPVRLFLTAKGGAVGFHRRSWAGHDWGILQQRGKYSQPRGERRVLSGWRSGSVSRADRISAGRGR